MAPVQGKDFRLLVESDTPGTYVLVDYMNDYSRDTSRSTDSVAVFGLDTPPSIVGPRDQTYSVSGLFDPGSAGQQFLRDAEKDGVPINIKVLFDGTNGFTQLVKVNSMNHGADPEAFQSHGFDFTADADAVLVGTGPLM